MEMCFVALVDTLVVFDVFRIVFVYRAL